MLPYVPVGNLLYIYSYIRYIIIDKYRSRPTAPTPYSFLPTLYFNQTMVRVGMLPLWMDKPQTNLVQFNLESVNS